jgi:hypothetical protein
MKNGSVPAFGKADGVTTVRTVAPSWNRKPLLAVAVAGDATSSETTTATSAGYQGTQPASMR